MDKGIKRFYERVKLEKAIQPSEEEQPITWVKVFLKEYPRLPSVKLPDSYDPTSALDGLLQMRESSRVFSEEPLELKEISRILRSCRIVDRGREPQRRTYPSGGARFPVELYLAAYNIRGLEPGAYHYNIKEESLERLWKKDLRDMRRELISPFLENPAATLIFTSVIPRSEVKYGPRAYPYSLLEAGHMGQNICLACAEIGIGSCSVSGFVDSTAAKILDLTADEIPIYTISIGKRTK